MAPGSFPHPSFGQASTLSPRFNDELMDPFPFLKQESKVPGPGGEHDGEADKAKKETAPLPPVPLKMLFYFADTLDVLLMCIGGLAAAGTGCIMPIFALIFSNTTDAINTGSDEERRHNATKYSLYFLALAGVSMALNFIQSSCLATAAERQVRKMRESFLKAVLRQEIGWFDVGSSGELTTRIKGDTLLVQQGIGEKLGLGIQFFATFVAGFVIGFSKGMHLVKFSLSGSRLGVLLARRRSPPIL